MTTSDTFADRDPMETGTVAVLDALGFKGIWTQIDPRQVIFDLKFLKGNVSSLAAASNEFGRALRRRHIVRFLSDTVVIACTCTFDREKAPDHIVSMLDSEPAIQELMSILVDMWSLEAVCDLAAKVQWTMAKVAAQLPYRGAVSFGRFLIDEEFLIGPAVDEAAAAEKLAEGAMVWLCPSALEIYHRAIASADQLPAVFEPIRSTIALVEDYDLPLKNSRSLVTCVVNPFTSGLADSRDACVTVRDRILAAFDPNDRSLGRKLNNTREFLEVALSKTVWE